MTESVRIGRPPESPAAPPRRGRGRLVAVCAAAIGLLAIAAAATGVAFARHDANRPAFTTGGSPTPVAMTESAACTTIVPVVTAGLNELTAIFKDPSRDTAALADIAEQLRALEPITPDALRQELVAVDKVFQGVADAHGDHGRISAAIGSSPGWSDAGLRIGARCRPYASA